MQGAEDSAVGAHGVEHGGFREGFGVGFDEGIEDWVDFCDAQEVGLTSVRFEGEIGGDFGGGL